jgi:hypothetical protein
MPTWTCPLNSSHRWTGSWSKEWIEYLNHFLGSHTRKIATYTAFPDPSLPYQIYIPIDSIFGKATQIDYIRAKVYWKSASGAYNYHFYEAYFKSPGPADAFPSKLRCYHGVIGSSGSFWIGNVPSDPISGRPSNRMDLDRVLEYILISAYDATKNDDYLDKADIEIAGWI